MKLDWKKIEAFEAELKKGMTSGETARKYGGWNPPGCDLPLTHILYTLKAHARGRIHARKLGKVCVYADGVPREKGSGIMYRLLKRTYRCEINTLEEQSQIFGKFIQNFVASTDEKAA